MLSVNLEQMILRYYADLGTPYALKQAILLRHGEYGALLEDPPRVTDYDSPLTYLQAAAAHGFLKKLPGLLDNSSERRAKAVAKWFEAESSCYRANQRLYPYLPNTSLERDPRIAEHLSGIKDVVVELIGHRPPELLEGRFGPGATFADRGRSATVPHKINANPTLTSDVVWFLPQFLGTAWGAYVASERELVFVRGNRFTTVDKTSVIDRSIAIEPSINVFYQLAAGKALRNRLRGYLGFNPLTRKRVGWDLDTAQDVHRAVAAQASVSREFATLDLSSASDTVAYNLVKLLLPPRWFELLDGLRSPMTTHPDHPEKWVKLEKFSSMGNGYTFELETVLFAAIAIYASRVCGHVGYLGIDTFVFGDDIIVKDDVVRCVTALLNFLGFSLNSEKSFSGDSPFRESCGADFYQGVDVRPAHLKDIPDDIPGCFGVFNQIANVDRRVTLAGGHMGRRSRRHILSQLPLAMRSCFGPPRLGDSVLHAEEAYWRVKWRHSIRYVRGIKVVPRTVVRFSDFPPSVVLACALYGTGNVGTPERGHVPEIEGVTPRSPVVSCVVGWLPTS